MDCRRVENLLPAYLEDGLPVRRAQEIARHLMECARCRQERQTLERALRALDRVGARTPHIDLWASFSERLAVERAAERASRRHAGLRWRRAAAGALAGAVAAGACIVSLLSAAPLPSLIRLNGPSPVAGSPAVTAQQNAPAEAKRALPETGKRLAVRSPEPVLELPEILVPSPAPPPVKASRGPLRERSIVATRPLAQEKAPAAAPKLPAAAPPAPDRLASVAEVLMDAPQEAARARVASEVVLLAREMLRAGDETDEETEDPL